MNLAPCHEPGADMNHCARAVFALHVEQVADLTGKWAGWRLRGRELVSPHGDRVTPQRLAALLYLEGIKAVRQEAAEGSNVIPIGSSHNSAKASL